MATGKSLNTQLRELSSNAEAMGSLTGSDRNFIDNLLVVQDRTGNQKLTARQRNLIKGILEKVDAFLKGTS